MFYSDDGSILFDPYMFITDNQHIEDNGKTVWYEYVTPKGLLTVKIYDDLMNNIALSDLFDYISKSQTYIFRFKFKDYNSGVQKAFEFSLSGYEILYFRGEDMYHNFRFLFNKTLNKLYSDLL